MVQRPNNHTLSFQEEVWKEMLEEAERLHKEGELDQANISAYVRWLHRKHMKAKTPQE